MKTSALSLILALALATPAFAGDRHILQWFHTTAVPEPVRPVVAPLDRLARAWLRDLPPGTERAIAMRKLLEERDAAVRAASQREPHE